MTVRTSRLGRGATPGADVVGVAFTADAGETTILKDWRIATPAGNTVSRAVVFLASSGGGIVPIFDGPLSAFDVKGGEVWMVLLAGDEIRVLALEHPGFEYWFSGTELNCVAP